MKTPVRLLGAMLGSVLVMASPPGDALASQQSETVYTVPSNVSPQWKDLLAVLARYASQPAPTPGPDDFDGWRRAEEQYAAATAPFSATTMSFMAKAGMIKKDANYGGVNVTEVTPKQVASHKRILLYLHGGAYTYGSAEINLGSAAYMAQAASLPVISVDYTLAPKAKWDAISDQVLAVYGALLKKGYRSRDIGLYGDSAGGGLAAGAVLKMRDRGIAVPGAVVLWSPWADITATGDSYDTLKEADPLLRKASLQASADAYAAPADQKNPYVSPVYGRFDSHFPPTLIQGGTKEIFLSHFIRLYQAIDSAGGTAKLDLYDGMPHVFQVLGSQTPEAQLSFRKCAEFWTAYLGKSAHGR